MKEVSLPKLLLLLLLLLLLMMMMTMMKVVMATLLSEHVTAQAHASAFRRKEEEAMADPLAGRHQLPPTG